MIELDEVGAKVDESEVKLGVYLPGIRASEGYELKARVIHERDQFTDGIPPVDLPMEFRGGQYDLWQGRLALVAEPGSGSYFGEPGRYLYRYQLRKRPDVVVAEAFGDPFARQSGLGTYSAFEWGPTDDFVWSDDYFEVPALTDLVVYELMVDEFNSDFEGIVARLDYLTGLGVNALELMPVTNIREPFRWGYMPLSHFAPEDRYGGPVGMKRLVDECHQRGVAVILDAVYAHAHPQFPYRAVYWNAGVDNPMMGPFAEDLFEGGIDFAKPFTRDYFEAVNRHWIDEYHVDGFRYDYVPGYYDGPVGRGFANLAYQTYRYSKGAGRFKCSEGASRIIQCAEYLPDPKGIMRSTYANCAWQDRLLGKAHHMAEQGYVDDHFAHQLLLLDFSEDPWPLEYRSGDGDRISQFPFQYLETHDHRRLVMSLGGVHYAEDSGFQLGDRSRWYKLQPFAIALMTSAGVPMLWQGQELAENYGLPETGWARVLAARPLHWDYFYEESGRTLVSLYRRLGQLRKTLFALRSRDSYYYYVESRPAEGLIAFRRQVPGHSVLVFLNFSDQEGSLSIPFPQAGVWLEQLHQNHRIQVDHSGQERTVVIPSNYGKIYALS